jgi:hypothetical protein
VEAPGSLDVESRGGLSRSTDLRTVTWANNWGTLFCAFPHPNCAKWVYAVFFLIGILLAWSSRYIELSAFTQRTNGYNDDRYLLGAEGALRVSLAFFVSAQIFLVTTSIQFATLLCSRAFILNNKRTSSSSRLCSSQLFGLRRYTNAVIFGTQTWAGRCW